MQFTLYLHNIHSQMLPLSISDKVTTFQHNKNGEISEKDIHQRQPSLISWKPSHYPSRLQHFQTQPGRIIFQNLKISIFMVMEIKDYKKYTTYRRHACHCEIKSSNVHRTSRWTIDKFRQTCIIRPDIWIRTLRYVC
jgi:hypothetical protein